MCYVLGSIQNFFDEELKYNKRALTPFCLVVSETSNNSPNTNDQKHLKSGLSASHNTPSLDGKET